MFMLTACGSDYDDASVDIPTTWAAYTVDTLSFRFEAGYQSSSWDAMQTLNDLSTPLLKLSVSSSQLQSSRIRTYGAVTALTTAFTVETEDLSCVLQAALVPHGSRVYLISYADFSTGADNDMLEGLLSTLQFSD